ncbi:hypothetical protein [Carnobacterium divergens]|uniref:Uncharacterized protein n=1 Tax=Carnobacterium divergens TaxID=2748 RepID=A0A7Z8CY87_CARDV|nr:hypothetical protein [Carnobacterium divergens]TFI70098.1 hypothetical protein CKN58_11755 [Carnobacterium divergens]TFI75092.1 hypothetical protein CKN85_11810 [Carnobacterium divergens]TFI80916.1 hypothetical protein CKN56_11840 [Carnobacterium divergens]TFI93323.1 hypothetical protein CKN64_11775 [Carnobacterium divergens]TFJ09355.1 hypothetical protein CKN60_11805 [Carnobacterium divergens]
MTDKKYTHKIVMFDVNSAKRVAVFDSGEAAYGFSCVFYQTSDRFKLSACDSEGTTFVINNIVQINPVEVIEHD